MATPSPALMSTIASRHGVIATAELLADGIGPSTIRGLVRGRVLVRVHGGVYRLATSPDSFEARCAAPCLADGEGVVTGLAAARLWEFRHTPRPDHPEVLVGHDRRPLTRGVLVRRTNVLETEDVVVRDDGMRVTTPPRCWFDCARRLEHVRFEKLTEWVLDRHAAVPQLWRVTRRLAARGRPGSARVRRVMSQRSDWHRRRHCRPHEDVAPAKRKILTRTKDVRGGGVNRCAGGRASRRAAGR